MARCKLSPSILNADFTRLGEEIRSVEKYSDYIHLDVMDGHFVPNITFGPLVVKAVRALTRVPLDVHLMISNPLEWVETFADAGADRLAFHVRSCRDIEGVIRAVAGLGVSPGVALSPEVPVSELSGYLPQVDFVLVMCVYPGFGGQKLIPEMLERIGEVKKEAAGLGTDIEVEVDGGINTQNLYRALEAGADTLVVGSSIFASDDTEAAARRVRGLLDAWGEGAASGAAG